MATKTEAKESAVKGATVTHSGVVLDGKIVVGVDHGLTAKQQGQKARGELDENNKPIVKEEKASGGSTAGSAAANAARTDKEKAEDIQIEEKRKRTLKEDGTVSGLRAPHKTSETLYMGKISVEAVAGTTGEEVSYVFDVAEPTTEEGVKDMFMAAYGSNIIRDTIKLDPTNKVDPTKRTYLEQYKP